MLHRNYTRIHILACSIKPSSVIRFDRLPIKHSCVYITLQNNRNDGLTYVIVFFFFWVNFFCVVSTTSTNTTVQIVSVYLLWLLSVLSYANNIPLHCHSVNSSVYLCSLPFFPNSSLFVGIFFSIYIFFCC